MSMVQLKIEKLPVSLLSNKAKFIRREVVRVAVGNEAGHIAPSLSCVDILVALYYQIMKLGIDPKWEERDRLILSKAHGCYGLYAVLVDRGYLKKNDWEMLYKGSPLSGCIERCEEHSIEAGCGALGHGLPMAVGVAFGAKLQNKNYRVYCIVGDGEMQEGSNWEAIQFAVKYGLTNLTIIIDNNGLQAMDFVENILTPKGMKDDLLQKTKAFGCLVQACDGHKIEEIVKVLEHWQQNEKELYAPQVLVAHTIKGYGLLCMENIPKFHFRLPTKEELEQGNRYE